MEALREETLNGEGAVSLQRVFLALHNLEVLADLGEERAVEVLEDEKAEALFRTIKTGLAEIQDTVARLDQEHRGTKKAG